MYDDSILLWKLHDFCKKCLGFWCLKCQCLHIFFQRHSFLPPERKIDILCFIDCHPNEPCSDMLLIFKLSVGCMILKKSILHHIIASAAFLQMLNAAANKWSLYFSTNTSVAILMSDPSYFFSD